jgi:preprotein translocase subunit YajC
MAMASSTSVALLKRDELPRPLINLAKSNPFPRLTARFVAKYQNMNLCVLLADAAPQQTQVSPLIQLVPLVIIMGGFLFITTRMQKKKAREHEQRIKSLKRGDKIATSSGIIGTVVNISDKSISIRSADSKLEIIKSAVGDVIEHGTETSGS